MMRLLLITTAMMRVLLITTAISFAVGVFPAFAQVGGGCETWCRANYCSVGGVSGRNAVDLVNRLRARAGGGAVHSIKTGCEQMQQTTSYSITSSARARKDSGILSPRASAVVRLTANSNLVGCSTGRSPGFAPRKILST
jgi:hypothetical protein